MSAVQMKGNFLSALFHSYQSREHDLTYLERSKQNHSKKFWYEKKRKEDIKDSFRQYGSEFTVLTLKFDHVMKTTKPDSLL